MSTIGNKWEKGVGETMKYETPVMETITLNECDIITLSTTGQGSGTVLNPFAPSTTSSDWE